MSARKRARDNPGTTRELGNWRSCVLCRACEFVFVPGRRAFCFCLLVRGLGFQWLACFLFFWSAGSPKAHKCVVDDF